MPYSLPMKFKMTKRDVLKRARKIFKQENVTFQILHEFRGGLAYPKDSHVIVGTSGYTEAQLASTACHELAHILNFRNKKFLRYHDYGRTTVYTKELAQMRLRIGLRAELYTDKVAEKIMKRYYPELKFVKCYDTKRGRKWYKETFLKPAREFLKEAK